MQQQTANAIEIIFLSIRMKCSGVSEAASNTSAKQELYICILISTLSFFELKTSSATRERRYRCCSSSLLYFILPTIAAVLTASLHRTPVLHTIESENLRCGTNSFTNERSSHFPFLKRCTSHLGLSAFNIFVPESKACRVYLPHCTALINTLTLTLQRISHTNKSYLTYILSQGIVCNFCTPIHVQNGSEEQISLQEYDINIDISYCIVLFLSPCHPNRLLYVVLHVCYRMQPPQDH